MPFNIPILLTWLRIILIPLLIAIYYVPDSWVVDVGRDLAAMLVFVVASVTDWLDGYLARRWNETSAFGAFLDPVADKLVVAAALIMLVQLGRLDAIFAAIIIGREITISALREWMAQIGAHKSVAVSMVGKIKTAAQMVSIPMPKPRHSTARMMRVAVRLSRGNRFWSDSATASNMFCSELTPAKIMATYKMTAKSRPSGMSCRMVGSVTNSRPGPAPTSCP